jgi:dolichol-phosphate mannosyltransferase
MSVSVVMPCFNEEKTIVRVVEEFYEVVSRAVRDFELIVVDDCSRDASPALLQGLAQKYGRMRVLRNDTQQGHGASILRGFAASSKEYVFQVDSDGQFVAEDFLKIYALRQEYDFIRGVRTPRRDSWQRQALSRVIAVADTLLFGVWCPDANCPFRLIKRSVLQELLRLIPSSAGAPNLMLSLAAGARKVRMRTVPVTHLPRVTGAIWLVRWRLIAFCLRGAWQLLILRVRLWQASSRQGAA